MKVWPSLTSPTRLSVWRSTKSSCAGSTLRSRSTRRNWSCHADWATTSSSTPVSPAAASAPVSAEPRRRVRNHVPADGDRRPHQRHPYRGVAAEGLADRLHPQRRAEQRRLLHRLLGLGEPEQREPERHAQPQPEPPGDASGHEHERDEGQRREVDDVALDRPGHVDRVAERRGDEQHDDQRGDEHGEERPAVGVAPVLAPQREPDGCDQRQAADHHRQRKPVLGEARDHAADATCRPATEASSGRSSWRRRRR